MTEEAQSAYEETRYAGYNPMSMQYAQRLHERNQRRLIRRRQIELKWGAARPQHADVERRPGLHTAVLVFDNRIECREAAIVHERARKSGILESRRLEDDRFVGIGIVAVGTAVTRRPPAQIRTGRIAAYGSCLR